MSNKLISHKLKKENDHMLITSKYTRAKKVDLLR